MLETRHPPVPRLFARGAGAPAPGGQDDNSRVTGDWYARICGSPGCDSLGPPDLRALAKWGTAGTYLICRQPPALLLAAIWRSMAVRAWRGTLSPRRKAMVRAVLLPCPPVMMPCASGTIAPS